MVFLLLDVPDSISLPPIPTLTSIITPSSHRVPPLGFIFFTFMCQHHVRHSKHAPTKKFFPNMVFKCCDNIQKLLVSTAIPSLRVIIRE